MNDEKRATSAWHMHAKRETWGECSSRLPEHDDQHPRVRMPKYRLWERILVRHVAQHSIHFSSSRIRVVARGACDNDGTAVRKNKPGFFGGGARRYEAAAMRRSTTTPRGRLSVCMSPQHEAKTYRTCQ